MLRPARLKAGDRIAAVSLSHGWPHKFPEAYRDGKRQLEKAFNVTVVERRCTLAEPDWLAAHPEARAFDLMDALLDPSIRGVVSTIGGDDSIRMLPFLDLSVIRKNPKVFLGYSDSTVTHFAFLKAGVTSFYGPSIMAGFDENAGLNPYMETSVRRLLFEPTPSLKLAPNPTGWTTASWEWPNKDRNLHRRRLTPSLGWKWRRGQGIHTGHLVGGCLDVMGQLLAGSLWPDPSVWSGCVLFIEISEDVRSVEAMVAMLRAIGQAGALAEIHGILFGRPPTQETQFDEYDKALLEVLNEFCTPTVPVVTQMDFGHTDPKLTLPLGIPVQIDCDRQELRLIEPATV